MFHTVERFDWGALVAYPVGYSFLAFLDEMQARGWLVQCSERHTWYNYLLYLFSRQGNTEYVEPRQVKVVIAPLVVGNTDIEDYRNVALLAEGLYVESARVGAGTYYAILGGKVNYLPLIRTGAASFFAQSLS